MGAPTPKAVFAAKKDTHEDEEHFEEMLNDLHARTVNPSPPQEEKSEKASKKPFVRKEHLTQRVIKSNPGLVALRKSIAEQGK